MPSSELTENRFPLRRKHHESENTRVTPFLWFDHQAEEAAKFYTSLFGNSKIVGVTRYGDAGPGPKGSVMTVAFELDGPSWQIVPRVLPQMLQDKDEAR